MTAPDPTAPAARPGVQRDPRDCCPDDGAALTVYAAATGGPYEVRCPTCGRRFPGVLDALRRDAAAYRANADYERGIE